MQHGYSVAGKNLDLYFPRLPAPIERTESQSTRNQESTVWPDHRDSERKDLVQDDPGRRGLEQNVRSPVWEHDDVSHIEEYQE